jgi:glyoxylase-like metal-dependent hydrolase (beta-lactamase superfamily II)
LSIYHQTSGQCRFAPLPARMLRVSMKGIPPFRASRVEHFIPARGAALRSVARRVVRSSINYKARCKNVSRKSIEFFRFIRVPHKSRNHGESVYNHSIKRGKNGSAIIDLREVRKMKLQVLGCAGGIGGHQRLTTCLLLDDDILLDAGTGISSLDIDQLARIDHVFITHCHLDHVAGLALLVDAVRGKRSGAVTVHASEHVIDALKTHLFNWILWPDFAAIPSADDPVLRWQPFKPGASVDVGGRIITSHPVNHTAGSVAYRAHDDHGGFLFSGDMSTTPELWAKMRDVAKLSKVIVDCSFPNSEFELSVKSMHFCPRSLLDDIAGMPHSIEFLIYHLKPGQEDLIMDELCAGSDGRAFRALKSGDVFEF